MSLAQDYLAACLAQDQNLHPAFRQAFAPQQYRASLGWHRVFLSANDARQYDAGYSQWPDPMPDDAALSTPYSCGWMDHESDALRRLDARYEEGDDD